MDAGTFEAHPIAELIAQMLDEGGPGEEIVVMSAQSRAMLEEVIDEYAKLGTHELMHVAQTMYSLADRLEDKNARSAADSLVAVLNRSNVLGAMQMVNEQLRNHLGAVELGRLPATSSLPSPRARPIGERPRWAMVHRTTP